jgi:hypothetical protein
MVNYRIFASCRKPVATESEVPSVTRAPGNFLRAGTVSGCAGPRQLGH